MMNQLRRRSLVNILLLTLAGTALASDLEDAQKLMQAGNPAQAYEQLSLNVGLHQTDVEYLYTTAVAAIDSGSTTAAIPLFEQVIKLEPDHAGAHLDLGRAYFHVGKRDEARREFNIAQDQSPPAAASGQMLNPTTGQPVGAIGGAGGGAGGGSIAATITLPADMVWPGNTGISAAEIATGRVTIVCPDPFFCNVKNPASTFVNNGSDVATQQAWGVWQGAANATSGFYLKAAPGSAQINFSSNNTQSIYAYAIGPMFTGVLPATGTFNYIYLGGVITNPTTSAVGTVNSASLTVNFTAATVQNTLNATIAGTTYAVNTPASAINANGSIGIGTTCTPACNATVFTAFNGAAGAGAIITTNIGSVMAQTVFKR